MNSITIRDSWFWVCGESVRDFSKLHQMTYFNPPNSLWALTGACSGPKKFLWLWPSDYSDSRFADFGESKIIFFKSSPNGLWAPGGAYSGLKKFLTVAERQWYPVCPKIRHKRTQEFFLRRILGSFFFLYL